MAKQRKDYGPVPEEDWEQDIPAKTKAELDAMAPASFHARMKTLSDRIDKVMDKAAKAKDQDDGQKTDTRKAGSAT